VRIQVYYASGQVQIREQFFLGPNTGGLSDFFDTWGSPDFFNTGVRIFLIPGIYQIFSIPGVYRILCPIQGFIRVSTQNPGIYLQRYTLRFCVENPTNPWYVEKYKKNLITPRY